MTAQLGAATFQGAGLLRPNATRVLGPLIYAQFAGAGRLSADVQFPRATNTNAAHLGALGELAIGQEVGGPRVSTPASTTLAGAGSLSARATILGGQVTARFAGSGSLSALVLQIGIHFIDARFAGAGSLSVATEVHGVKQGAATFAGSGSLRALLGLPQSIAATFQGNGVLAPMGAKTIPIQATLQGAGLASFSGFSHTPVQSIAVRFDGAGRLVVLPPAMLTVFTNPYARVLYTAEMTPRFLTDRSF
jgi:hypothetical protein